MTKLSQLNPQNLKWLGRMALIIVVVMLADGLVGEFARKPLPWVGIIPGLIPLLTSVFVLYPMMKAEKDNAPGV